MKISILNINTARSSRDQIRFCFYAYFFFLIFEGAIRKWILPGASNLFLVIRDPIVIYVFLLALKISKTYFNNFTIKFLVILSTVTFILTLLFGHQNLLVAIYGVRITLFHLPAMFIFGIALKRFDLQFIGKAVMYITVFMTILIGLQYFTPQNSIFNRGVGGNEEGAGFSGVGEYFRPSGTFSFISGMVGFEFLAGTFVIYYFFENKNLPLKYKLKKYELLLPAIFYFISIFLCLSRSVIFQTILLILWASITFIFHRKNAANIIPLLFFGIIFYTVILQIPYVKTASDNVVERFTQAGESEGGLEGTLVDRYLGSYTRAFTDPQNFTGKDIPPTGFGIGIGSKVGEKILNLKSTHSFAVAEEEWSRIICEMGFLIGALFLIYFRLYYTLKICIEALNKYLKTKDFLPYIFVPFFLIFLCNRQMNIPVMLGFIVIVGSIMIAGLKTNNK